MTTEPGNPVPGVLPDLTATRSLLEADRRSGGGRRRLVLDVAERLLAGPVPTVTQKRFEPPGFTTSPRDYVSLQTYWWPNEDEADGLPYERRDGRVSPEVARYDRPRWDHHSDGLRTLLLAAAATGEARYAEAGRAWAHAWYVGPETRMNPHLLHAQFLPGVNEGTLVGCIDFTVRLPWHLATLDLLRSLDTTAAAGDVWAGVDAWWAELLGWLDGGKVRGWHDERSNNLGVFYDGAVVNLALRHGRPDTADGRLERVLTNRVARQIEPDGRMPEELARTRPWGYTTMNLLGFIHLCRLDERRGGDLFNQATADGRSVRGAFEFVWRFARSEEAWTYPDLDPFDGGRLLVCRQMLPERERGRYPLEEIAHRLPAELRERPDAVWLLPKVHPFRPAAWDEDYGQPVPGVTDARS
jgi:hypothetical protein